MAQRVMDDDDEPYKGGDFSGRFPVIKAIGRGGMAVVYEVYDLDAEERRALKVVRPKYKLNHKILERTLAEARAGITLRHPNLVRVYQVGTDGNNLCILMELLEGRTLREVLEERGRLPLAEALDLCAQIAGALHALHEAGIIHRDVKPENIYITTSGEVKILDLGAAKYLKENPNTTEGHPMGTPLYMSPEHLNSINVDARTDIFSVGHILYYCIAGHHALVPDPQHQPVLGQIVSRQLHEPPVPLTERVLGLPHVVWELVAPALEKDRERRYTTAAELAGAIRATAAWLDARGLLQVCDPPPRPPDVEAGDPRRSIVRVMRPGERAPSNLPYVSTAEGSPSLTSASRASVVVEADGGADGPEAEPTPPARGSHGTEILDLAAPALPANVDIPEAAKVFGPRTGEAWRADGAAAAEAAEMAAAPRPSRPTPEPIADARAWRAEVDQDEVRVAALAAMPPSADRTHGLADRLFWSLSEDARCAAAATLVEQGDDEAVIALAGGAICELEVSERLRAVVEAGLARLAPALATPGAGGASRPARVARLAQRVEAIEARYQGEAMAIGALSAALQRHPFVEVRGLCAQALARIADMRCKPALEAALREEKDRHVRRYIEEALAQAERVGTQKDLQALLAARSGDLRLAPTPDDATGPPLWLLLLAGASAIVTLVLTVLLLQRIW